MIVELLLGKRLPAGSTMGAGTQDRQQGPHRARGTGAARGDIACAGCHAKIDPYGFVLEHYDPAGAWRDRDKGKPVNASTVLDDGTEVDGLPEFRRYVLDQRADDITRNVISRLLAFALSSELIFTDEATILELMEQSKHDGHKPRTLLHHLVQSRFGYKTTLPRTEP